MIKLIDIVKEVDKRLMEEKMKEIHILFPTQSILPLIFYLVLMGIKSLKKTLLTGFQTSLKKYL